ncbi:hypothetical protein [Actinoplanes regularis]|uniref:Uncharacterized protein n=1 Tax=Actinoplanes regularis TaxID=52697 RepID=A0A239C1U8_9ACTN|nr:hypothetical protein [Actinoplanes regularis]GIE88168.1 hypothetical protein Are01nite_46480 [Actinoplanes regularis]SNS13899.1 hypothetical protein SAMN06264365_110247 [Actinoplanes regularis]
MATAREKVSGSSPSPLDALERRVAALERDRELLMERYARQLELDNEQLRALLGGAPDLASAPGTSTDAVPSIGPASDPATAAPASAAAMLAHTLGLVEDQVDDVERLAAAGESASAVDTALLVTRRSAAALRASVADAELRENLVTSMTPPDSPLPPPPGLHNFTVPVGGNRTVPFRVAEIAVLQLAGLRRSLAEKHVDAAIAEYERVGAARAAVDLHQVLDRIEAVQRAIAHAETVLPFVINQPPQRLRWRKLVTFGLGGTLIVAANAGAAVVIGPVAAAVSAAVGSAAIGAAAAPLVM